LSSGELHYFIKTPPAIVLADRISFFISHMAVSGDEDTNSIRGYRIVSKEEKLQRANAPEGILMT
jgi:hypothetical protein